MWFGCNFSTHRRRFRNTSDSSRVDRADGRPSRGETGCDTTRVSIPRGTEWPPDSGPRDSVPRRRPRCQGVTLGGNRLLGPPYDSRRFDARLRPSCANRRRRKSRTRILRFAEVLAPPAGTICDTPYRCPPTVAAKHIGTCANWLRKVRSLVCIRAPRVPIARGRHRSGHAPTVVFTVSYG